MPTVNEVTNKIIDRHKNKKKGWTNSYGYQCVALMQYFLNHFKFKDGWLASAWKYGEAFRKALNNNKDVMGLSHKDWDIVTKNYKKGDTLFYKPTLTNQYGHVAQAISSTNRLEQNMVWPYDGSYPYLTSNIIGNPAYALRKVTKIKVKKWAKKRKFISTVNNLQARLSPSTKTGKHYRYLHKKTKAINFYGEITINGYKWYVYKNIKGKPTYVAAKYLKEVK